MTIWEKIKEILERTKNTIYQKLGEREVQPGTEAEETKQFMPSIEESGKNLWNPELSEIWYFPIQELKNWKQEQGEDIKQHFKEKGFSGSTYEATALAKIDELYDQQKANIEGQLESFKKEQIEQYGQAREKLGKINYEDKLNNALNSLKNIPQDKGSLTQWFGSYADLFSDVNSPYYDLGQQIKQKLGI